jgi:hypothetical protein
MIDRGLVLDWGLLLDDHGSLVDDAASHQGGLFDNGGSLLDDHGLLDIIDHAASHQGGLLDNGGSILLGNDRSRLLDYGGLVNHGLRTEVLDAGRQLQEVGPDISVDYKHLSDLLDKVAGV